MSDSGIVAMRPRPSRRSRNAATATEALATKNDGSYGDLDGKGDDELIPWGYNPTSEVPVTIVASNGTYCIAADHIDLGQDWKYSSAAGRPQPGACSGPGG